MLSPTAIVQSVTIRINTSVGFRTTLLTQFLILLKMSRHSRYAIMCKQEKILKEDSITNTYTLDQVLALNSQKSQIMPLLKNLLLDSVIQIQQRIKQDR